MQRYIKAKIRSLLGVLLNRHPTLQKSKPSFEATHLTMQYLIGHSMSSALGSPDHKDEFSSSKSLKERGSGLSVIRHMPERFDMQNAN